MKGTKINRIQNTKRNKGNEKGNHDTTVSKEEQDTYGAVMWEVKAGGGKVPLTTTSISLTESDVYWMVGWWEGQVQRSELKVVMVVMGRGGVSDAGEG